MSDRRKQKRIFHINMLHKWNAPTAISCWADNAAESNEDDDGPVSYFDCVLDGEAVYCNSLMPQQLADLHSKWLKFSVVSQAAQTLRNITSIQEQ